MHFNIIARDISLNKLKIFLQKLYKGSLMKIFQCPYVAPQVYYLCVIQPTCVQSHIGVASTMDLERENTVVGNAEII